MFSSIDPIYVFYAGLAGVSLILVDTLHMLTATATSYRQNVDRRLGLLEKQADRAQAVIDLRRERGLGEFGGAHAAASWFRKLVIQSGVTRAAWKIAVFAVVATVAGTVGGYMARGVFGAVSGGIACGVALPFGGLIYLRNRRRAKFTDQFAEALEIIVRSLKAGHPVPAAIKMVAREMADPMGTEFGMAEDEIVYGLDIESAMRNMLERVGQEDLPLFVTSVAIQASTGGNLAEILANLTEVVRQRAKMRRKIRAISAEGRISAVILTSAPIIMFLAINWLVPDFYGKNWNHPWMTYGLSGAAAWMGLGNLIMRRMVNFKV